ncbi:unnamed protein product [Bursaphelenchus xylophilus]|uniref:(pine wood nematode) hypothetical protein n=1 Tax=Bursaphelenchus xylophilus TaxID=6326 RepID=A0A1I7RHJ3_BURXY|nr:unnamed protein product [Bursaphelenchus xylophilus]CAG9115689.1 unnamed protein product [Bursaphelenchus xylophilus]
MDLAALTNHVATTAWTSEVSIFSAPTISSYPLYPIDRIGESARNRFGRPYISGRPLLTCDRKKIIEMYNSGARKITIARTIGVTHSCVSKVIRKYEETGDVDNKSSRTASCACPGEADAHDPRICRHVKFRKEMSLIDWTIRKADVKREPRIFTIEWILSDHCAARSINKSEGLQT